MVGLTTDCDVALVMPIVTTVAGEEARPTSVSGTTAATAPVLKFRRWYCAAAVSTTVYVKLV